MLKGYFSFFSKNSISELRIGLTLWPLEKHQCFFFTLALTYSFQFILPPYFTDDNIWLYVFKEVIEMCTVQIRQIIQ
jgi:hypothetical protein